VGKFVHSPHVDHLIAGLVVIARRNEATQVLVVVDLRVGALLTQIPAIVLIERDLEGTAVPPDHRADSPVGQRDTSVPLDGRGIPDHVVLLESRTNLLVG